MSEKKSKKKRSKGEEKQTEDVKPKKKKKRSVDDSNHATISDDTRNEAPISLEVEEKGYTTTQDEQGEDLSERKEKINNHPSIEKMMKKKSKKKEKKMKKDKGESNSTGNTTSGEILELEDSTTNMTSMEKIDEKRGSNKGDKEDDTRKETTDVLQDVPTTPSTTQSNAKEVRKARREERKRLLDLVPKVDEHGISFTKLQIRRMRKRVARGLDPIETEEEKQERLREEAKMRREEEDELAGILYQKKPEGNNQPSNEETDEENEEDQGEEEQDDVDLDDTNKTFPESGQDNTNSDTFEGFPSPSKNKKEETSTERGGPSPKKRKRSKPVPADYTCQACQNKHRPPHWIYDCPSKITRRGSNAVSKKQNDKGVTNPDSRKIFVSGLPFDVTKEDVAKLFTGSCGKILSCKLITFDDSRRCKGQAILTFENESGAQKALKQDGNPIEKNTHNEKDSENSPTNKRKELKLSVSKVLSRAFTKRKRHAKS